MSQDHVLFVKKVAEKYGRDPTRLMDVLLEVNAQYGWFSEDTIGHISDAMDIPRVKVRDKISFYTFFSRKPVGKTVIRLSNSVVEKMKGADEIARAFEDATGIKFGETTPDGQITLVYAQCIGMSDQAPSALINHTPVGNLLPEDVGDIVDAIKKGEDISQLPQGLTDVNLRRSGPVVFAPMDAGTALRAALKMTPEGVIDEIKKSKLRGRGGAGFPTGKKWEACRNVKSDFRYIVCNADEGEPGTFKDRVIMSERADLVFEGMTIAGYAIGAEYGIVYLRGEYEYMLEDLKRILEERRKKGLLGKSILGKKDFNFAIRIQIGAGAYICGEESALIESLEGKRGAPRERPPFPVEKGYMNRPTAVNNVETLCAAARIVEQGADWFSTIGTEASAGTKLLSVSGDCSRPGVYEIEYGITVARFLKMVGAEHAIAAKIGGPSGRLVGPKDFDRTISFEDFSTGGSVIFFGPGRDLLTHMRQFTEFFVEESCGWCTPCRVGTTLMLKELDKVIEGRATRSDLENIKRLGETIKTMSRCGLGQTAPNPILTSMQNFPELYEAAIKPVDYIGRFDFAKAVAVGAQITGRKPHGEEEVSS
jgi:[NiFe] hydrogenase diaphorase moiety large subunit